MIRKETRIINGREAHLYYDEERQAYLVASDLMEVFLGLYENADGLVKAEESNNGWIPCSDAVPQDGDWVLCYGTNREGRIKYEVSTYAHEIQCWMCSRIADVIAWQPLPAPYKPGEK